MIEQKNKWKEKKVPLSANIGWPMITPFDFGVSQNALGEKVFHLRNYLVAFFYSSHSHEKHFFLGGRD
jgi:hypothetical protein